jgi:hypothetical protein
LWQNAARLASVARRGPDRPRRSELDLVAWDARALEGRSLALRLEPRPWTGYTLTHNDGRRFAWMP